MNSIIHILPALHGDAFILDLRKGENHGVVVVDSGPYIAGRKIFKNFYDYDKIDLMVISHFDDDHIAGIKKYAQEVSIGDKDWNVQQMWVNNSKDYPIELDTDQSLQQATTLADALEKINTRYPNFIWKPYISEGHTLDLGFTNIEVVSPPIEFEKYMIKRIKEQENLSEEESENQDDPLKISLDDLAKRPDHEPNLDDYDELANATSIAFVLRSDGLSILMLGDCYPGNVETYLRKKYSEQEKLKVDFVKISHHGSLINSSTSLYDIIECNNFIISTNGKKYGHPDREAIAKIVCHPHRSKEIINIYLNYTEDSYAPFLNDGEEKKYNFKVHYGINKLSISEQNNG